MALLILFGRDKNDRVDRSTQPVLDGAPSSRKRMVVALISAAALLGACGGSSDASPLSAAVPSGALSGVVREPAPRVDLVSLPSLTEIGSDVEFRARERGLLVVFFGYTNCPDVCPTSLVDLTVALRKLDPSDAARVDVVMVTVDPHRDLDRLGQYVTSFISTATAAGTADEAKLLAAAEPFGASWEVRTLGDGTVEVDHSAFVYVVDQTGHLAVTWQFGASSDSMSEDLSVLLRRYDA